MGYVSVFTEKMIVRHRKEIRHKAVEITGTFALPDLCTVILVGLQPFAFFAAVACGKELHDIMVLRMKCHKSLYLPCLTVADACHSFADKRQSVKCDFHGVLRLLFSGNYCHIVFHHSLNKL